MRQISRLAAYSYLKTRQLRTQQKRHSESGKLSGAARDLQLTEKVRFFAEAVYTMITVFLVQRHMRRARSEELVF